MRRSRLLGSAAVIVVAVVGYDLFGPWRADFRRFDADETARLETAMWRAYYERRPAALFLDLARFLRTQFHLPPCRSFVVAYHASRAAFVFKDGKSRTEYERALPDLERYFAALERVGHLGSDPRRLASVELEWWIVHRERDRHPRADLDRAVAEAAAAVYHLPVEKTLAHGRLRGEAMVIRDEKAAGGGVTEADWRRIEGLLRESYRSLSEALAAGDKPPRER
jgi:hypothetical protein